MRPETEHTSWHRWGDGSADLRCQRSRASRSAGCLLSRGRNRRDTDTHGSGVPRYGGYPIDPPTADVWENLRSRLVDNIPQKRPFYDEARGWPIFELIKQKKLTKVIPHTTKTLIYMGSKSSRRSNDSMKYRSKCTKKRFQQKPWANSAAQRNYW